MSQAIYRKRTLAAMAIRLFGYARVPWLDRKGAQGYYLGSRRTVERNSVAMLGALFACISHWKADAL